MKIATKIILIQIVLTVSFLLISGVVSFISNIRQFENTLQAEGEQGTEALATTLRNPLWDLEIEQVTTLMGVQMSNSNILAIILERNDGTLLGKYRNAADEVLDLEISTDLTEVFKSTLFSFEQNITYGQDNFELGLLKVYYSNKAVISTRNSQLLQILIELVVLSVAIAGIFSLYGARLGRNLKSVIQPLKAISEGKIRQLNTLSLTQNDEIGVLGNTFNVMLGKLQKMTTGLKRIQVDLNSSSKEIQAASEEQASSASVSASGITEVSATLEELSITAKQITKNTSELVLSSGEASQALEDGRTQLMGTVTQMEEVGKISQDNTQRIKELGKRSVLINEMVEIIKEVVNATNMLSINASIEASRAGELGKGFSVVAAEIRELSKETITSAKKVEQAAHEIQEFIDSIIISSESESEKVINSGAVARDVYSNIEKIINIIKKNDSFTQKIDVSIKQQERGSEEAAETMRQMAENSRQSAEVAKQTSLAVKDIVVLGEELQRVLLQFDVEAGKAIEQKID